MNTHLPVTILQLLDTECIVEVLGILRVDSTGKYLSEVLTLLIVLFCDFARNLVGSIFYILWIFVWQTILCEDGVHLHIIVTLLAENINHFADRTLVFLVRPFDDSYHGLVVGLATLELSSWDDDVVGEYIAWCDEVSDVLIHFQTAYEAILGTFQYLVDLSLLDMVLAASEEGELHTVAIERAHGVALRYEDRLLAAVRDDGVLAVGLAYELTFHHLYTLVEAIGIVTYLGEVVIPSHLLHDVDSEHLERVGSEMETPEYLFEAERYARLTGKEFLQLLSELRLVHSLATFLSFSHNSKS